MQTYAWRERTPQPDREYRRLHARYLRQMRESKKALRRKYGCNGIMSLADMNDMPRRVSMVSYSDAYINLHVYPHGGSYPITNSRANLGSRSKLMNWMLHLCRKPWITGRILFDFAELVSQLYGIDTSWNYAVEHSPFAGDWRDEGGVK